MAFFCRQYTNVWNSRSLTFTAANTRTIVNLGVFENEEGYVVGEEDAGGCTGYTSTPPPPRTPC